MGVIDSVIIRGQQDFEKQDQLNPIEINWQWQGYKHTKKIQKSNLFNCSINWLHTQSKLPRISWKNCIFYNIWRKNISRSKRQYGLYWRNGKIEKKWFKTNLENLAKKSFNKKNEASCLGILYGWISIYVVKK